MSVNLIIFIYNAQLFSFVRNYRYLNNVTNVI